MCADKLCEWQRQSVNVTTTDLKKAHLQIYIHVLLWLHQIVEFNGCRCCLSCLYSENTAPLVMKLMHGFALA